MFIAVRTGTKAGGLQDGPSVITLLTSCVLLLLTVLLFLYNSLQLMIFCFFLQDCEGCSHFIVNRAMFCLITNLHILCMLMLLLLMLIQCAGC